MALVDKAKAYADAMVKCLWLADAKSAVGLGLAAYDLQERLAYSHGAAAYETLAKVLMGDLIRSTWAFTLDRDTRAPSVANLWAMLNSADLRAELRAQALASRQSTDGSSVVGTDPTHDFDAALRGLETAVPAFLECEAAQRIYNARNRGVAHYNMASSAAGDAELFDLASVGLRWKHPTEFLAQARPIVLKLAEFLTQTQYVAQDHEFLQQMRAADFWSRVMGKGPIEANVLSATLDAANENDNS